MNSLLGILGNICRHVPTSVEALPRYLMRPIHKACFCLLGCGIVTAIISPASADIIFSGDTNEHSDSGPIIGVTGAGRLEITSGSVLSSGPDGFLGGQNLWDSEAKGAAVITGAGSRWTIDESLHVGYAGDGSLSIEGGGEVANKWGYIGHYGNSTATAVVTDSDSIWTNTEGLGVLGTLSIENGGKVISGGGSVGSSGLGRGAVTVSGEGSEWTSNTVYLNHGDLRIEDGGKVTSTIGELGWAQSVTDIVTVTGNGSKWISDNLSVGKEGWGTLNIEDGGYIKTENSTVGYDENGYSLYDQSGGIVSVIGPGSKWDNSGDLLIGNDAADAGTGAVNVENGGEINIVGQTLISTTGTLNIGAGGTFSTESVTITNGSIVRNDGILEGKIIFERGGKLHGNGRVEQVNVEDGGLFFGTCSFESLTVGDGGILSPGNSPGTMSGVDAIFEGGGTFLFEVSDALGMAGTGWDLLNLAGRLSITATTLNPFIVDIRSIALSNFNDQLSYRWTFLHAAGGIDGFNSDNIELLTANFVATNSGRFSIQQDGNDLFVSFQPAAVPEPSSWALMCIAFSAIGATAGRRHWKK